MRMLLRQIPKTVTRPLRSSLETASEIQHPAGCWYSDFGLFLIAIAARSFLQKQARAEVIHQAELLLSAAYATRNYTEQYITPVLQTTSQHSASFMPQAIPFFASTITFQQIRLTNPDYVYKEAALNPTKPAGTRPTDWEADINQLLPQCSQRNRSHPGKGTQ